MCIKKTAKGNKMTLTKAQILKIVEEKRISKCTEDEKDQIFEFMFGSEFMDSNDKGTIKEYK